MWRQGEVSPFSPEPNLTLPNALLLAQNCEKVLGYCLTDTNRHHCTLTLNLRPIHRYFRYGDFQTLSNVQYFSVKRPATKEATVGVRKRERSIKLLQ